MTDKAHPNYVETYAPTKADLDAMFARSLEQAEAKRAAQQHAKEWPIRIEETLAVLAQVIVALRERMDAFNPVIENGVPKS
jgi:hypothetical protein